MHLLLVEGYPARVPAAAKFSLRHANEQHHRSDGAEHSAGIAERDDHGVEPAHVEGIADGVAQPISGVPEGEDQEYREVDAGEWMLEQGQHTRAAGSRYESERLGEAGQKNVDGEKERDQKAAGAEEQPREGAI